MRNYRKPPRGILLIAHRCLPGVYWHDALLSHDSRWVDSLEWGKCDLGSLQPSLAAQKDNLVIWLHWQVELSALPTQIFGAPRQWSICAIPQVGGSSQPSPYVYRNPKRVVVCVLTAFARTQTFPNSHQTFVLLNCMHATETRKQLVEDKQPKHWEQNISTEFFRAAVLSRFNR